MYIPFVWASVCPKRRTRVPGSREVVFDGFVLAVLVTLTACLSLRPWNRLSTYALLTASRSDIGGDISPVIRGLVICVLAERNDVVISEVHLRLSVEMSVLDNVDIMVSGAVILVNVSVIVTLFPSFRYGQVTRSTPTFGLVSEMLLDRDKDVVIISVIVLDCAVKFVV